MVIYYYNGNILFQIMVTYYYNGDILFNNGNAICIIDTNFCNKIID